MENDYSRGTDGDGDRFGVAENMVVVLAAHSSENIPKTFEPHTLKR